MSVEMIEAVGREFLETRGLGAKRKGVVQVITIPEPREWPGAWH